jgi:hypothetical protein
MIRAYSPIAPHPHFVPDNGNCRQADGLLPRNLMAGRASAFHPLVRFSCSVPLAPRLIVMPARRIGKTLIAQAMMDAKGGNALIFTAPGKPTKAPAE